jgi:hypothetical protein
VYQKATAAESIMLSSENYMDKKRKALFAEMHAAIEEAAEAAINSLGANGKPLPDYPPGIEINQDEVTELSKLELSTTTKSALKKIIKDACAYPCFHLCSLLDGVTEPNVFPINEWDGGSLFYDDNDELMLHDVFYESYWDYEEKR